MKHLIAFVAIQACIKQVNTIAWKLDYLKYKLQYSVSKFVGWGQK